MKFCFAVMHDAKNNYYLAVPGSEWFFETGVSNKKDIDFETAREDFIAYVEEHDRWFKYKWGFRKSGVQNWFHTEFVYLHDGKGYIFAGLRTATIKKKTLKAGKRINIHIDLELLKVLDESAKKQRITRTRLIEMLIYQKYFKPVGIDDIDLEDEEDAPAKEKVVENFFDC